MVEIIWTNQAISDLKEIAEFIAKGSPRYAEITVQKIYSKTEFLFNFPKSGRVVPEQSDENVRELIEGNYRIIYEMEELTVQILTIHHSARNLRL